MAIDVGLFVFCTSSTSSGVRRGGEDVAPSGFVAPASVGPPSWAPVASVALASLASAGASAAASTPASAGIEPPASRAVSLDDEQPARTTTSAKTPRSDGDMAREGV